MQYDNLFPFSEPRPQQRQGIEFALKSFNQKKRFVIIEGAPGCGKSGIGLTIGRFLNNIYKKSDYKPGSYFLTTQKILQTQYINDFGSPGSMRSIKSAKNYQCKFFRHHTCSESLQLLKHAKKHSPFFRTCIGGCVYRTAKKDFLDSLESVTNFAYFLTETAYTGQIKPREFLVIDEAHNIEQELSKFIEVTISERFTNTILKIDMPKIKTIKKAIEWIRNEYLPEVSHLTEFCGKELKHQEKESEEAQKLANQIERLDSHYGKLTKFLQLYNDENWVFNRIKAEGKSGRKLEFKPIDVGAYSEEYLFKYGKKILMMSATILNKEAFCESIGIDPKEAAFISIDSPFPVENRLIHFLPAGRMNTQEIEATLPKMIKVIKDILETHPHEKGVIHCRTFKIGRYIKKHINNKRLLFHSTENREEIIDKHLTSKEFTVLVSPSVIEGIDLKDDLSRFQILCKVYWPYLGDQLVKARMEKYDHWYVYQAAKATIQGLGRSVRNKEDFATSYILDQSFEYFYESNQELFPDYFRKAFS